MIDFQRYTTRYHWSRSGINGFPGEIPGITIERTEPLPPLDKVQRVNVLSLSSRETSVEQSKVRLEWKTEPGVALIAVCSADDERLKAQYLVHQKMEVEIVELLVEAYQRNLLRAPYDDLGIFQEIKLAEEDIPPVLLPYVRQIDVWGTFVKPKRGVGTRESFVTADGFYAFFVSDRSLLWWNPDPDEIVHVASYLDVRNMEPVIESECVYWEIAEKKIAVILPHSQTTDEIAKRYGYTDVLERYREAKKEREQESLESSARYTEDRKRKMEEVRRRLRDALTGVPLRSK